MIIEEGVCKLRPSSVPRTPCLRESPSTYNGTPIGTTIEPCGERFRSFGELSEKVPCFEIRIPLFPTYIGTASGMATA